MPRHSWSIAIQRSPEDVFAFVAEGANTPQWRKAAVDDKWLDDGPMRPGRRGRAVRKAFGMRMELVAEIVDWDPPRYVSYRIIKGPPIEESYRFEPINDGCQFTITVESPPWPNRFVSRLITPIMVRQGRADFVTLKRLLESRT